MLKLLYMAIVTVGLISPARAVTEQEVVEALVGELQQIVTDTTTLAALHRVRFEASRQVASDGYQLKLLISGKQFAADVAVASARLAASNVAAQQARSQYANALGQALSRYQQALGRAHSEWTEDVSRALSHMLQDNNETVQTLHQRFSAVQQRTFQTLGGDFANMPPVIEVTLPDLKIEPTPAQEIVAELEKALDDARASYQADITQAVAECDQALNAALNLQPGAEMETAVRQAINKLKIVCFDRLDQYEAEVRSAGRNALLQTAD